MGFLYRAARLAQGSQSSARGRRAEKRAVARQDLLHDQQAEDYRYQMQKAADRGDMNAYEHFKRKLELMGVTVHEVDDASGITTREAIIHAAKTGRETDLGNGVSITFE